MGLIKVEHTFKDDDEIDVIQKVEYNSISNYITIEAKGQRINMQITEWEMLISLMNRALSYKGHSLHIMESE